MSENKVEKNKEDLPVISFNNYIQDYLGIEGQPDPVFRHSKYLDSNKKLFEKLLTDNSFMKNIHELVDVCLDNGYHPNDYNFFFNKRGPDGSKDSYLIEVLVFKR